MISEEDIEKIAVRVSELLREPRHNKTLSLKEAAVFMGIKAQDKSLSSLFSRFSSTRHFKKPLVTYKVGKERTYMEEDLRKFMDENRRRN
jgi:hypothetical protein